MPRLVIDAGVEEDVVRESARASGGRFMSCAEPAVAAPVVRHRAAAVRDDEAQRREILEQIRGRGTA